LPLSGVPQPSPNYEAWSQVAQEQSGQMQLLHESAQLVHWQTLWLHVGHEQSWQWQAAHESAQCGHEHVVHSS
jgi:hypothetical protein